MTDRDLSHISDADLLAEVERRRLSAGLTGRRNGMPCPPCRCGPLRKEILDAPAGPQFRPRTGCLTCNAWDGPVLLVADLENKLR